MILTPEPVRRHLAGRPADPTSRARANRRRGAARPLVGGLLAVGLVVAAAAPAEATWSIVAADPESGEVGAAIASCVPAEVLGNLDRPLVPVVLQPGRSAAVTQAQLNLDAPDRIIELTEAGASPTEIVEDLVSDTFDELAPLRQHAVAAVTGEVAAHTGADNSPVALDAQGAAVSVQGNLLVSEAVVEDALAAYAADRAAGAAMGDALVAALVAGADAGGDRRCDEQTALFAQIAVAASADPADAPGTILTVTVDEGDGQNPVALLASSYTAGERGLVELGAGENGGGSAVQLAAFAAVVVMIGAGIIAMRRGIGSVRARR